MTIRQWLLLTLAILPVLAVCQKLNFYLPPGKSKEAEKKIEVEKPAEKKSVQKKPADSAKPSGESSKASIAQSVRLRPQQPAQSDDASFNPPLDEFGLARAFRHRWDFSSFLMTPEEELRFRVNAARTRTLRIARAFSALANEVETRQRNLNTAALAAYLLSRDQATWAPIGGPNLTAPQMLAVRTTMQQDINAMRNALRDYETLRNSLNQSAEELAALEKHGLDAVESNAPRQSDRPTTPYTSIARSETNAVLDERLMSVGTLKAILAAEMLSASGDLRQSIVSFAPPPPQVHQDAPPFAADSGAVGKNATEHAGMKRPEQTALILPAPINAPVHAVRDGVIAYAGPFRGYGGMVIVEHEKGTFSIYSHLGSIEVRERQAVKAGAILGRAGIPPELGSSGVHFQVRKGKEVIKPADWLGANVAEKLLKETVL